MLAVRILLLSALLVSGVAPRVSGAVPLIEIGNGPTSATYLNATDIANTLYFTSISASAENEIRYVEAVDIANGVFGVSVFDVYHTAPVLTILGDVTIGYAGFVVLAPHVNLSGSIRTLGGVLITDAFRLDGGVATTVEVDSDAASLQQAIWLTQDSVGLSTVTALAGTATSLVFDYDTRMILRGGQLSGTVAMNHASSQLELHGWDFELDSGAGFQPVGTGPVAPLSGQLRGTLNSGDDFLVSFTQGAPGRIQLVAPQVPISGVAPLGVALLLAASGVLALRRSAGGRAR